VSFIGKSFGILESAAKYFTIEVLASIVKQKWVEEAAARATRPTERDRKLPGPFTTWLVIALGLYRSLSIQNVLRRIGSVFGSVSQWSDAEVPSSKATVQARNRLGFGAMRWLLRRFQDWLLDEHREAMSWRKLLLLIVDGSTLKMPDTEANQRFFGCPGSSRGGRAAFPQMRVLFVVSAKLRLVLRSWFAPYRRSEVVLASRVLDEIPRGSLMLLDRAYLSWWFLWRIQQRGDHFLVRVRRRINRRRLYSLGPADWRIRVRVPRALRRTHPEMPKFLELREVGVRIRGRWYHYFTSLEDATAYPAHELVEQYARRWEVETGFDELKTHQAGLATVNHPVMFRSAVPRRVLQEAYGLVIGYNVIRSLIVQAASRHHVEPLRISFTDTLDRVREAAPVMSAARTHELPHLFAVLLASIAACTVPERSRRNPRLVCVKMSCYDKKHKPLLRSRRRA